MRNQSSSSAGPMPISSRYQSSTIPDSFFATTSTRSRSDVPPPYESSSLTAIDTKPASKSAWARVVFTSSDLKYFSLARKNIDAHTGALIPKDWDSCGMTLPETSTTLSTLFEFIGAQKHPKLLNENFESLAEIAKAAEKYKVFSAMNTCSERMRAFGDRHPKLVLLYAAYNDYPHIFDECAPRVVTSERLEELVPLLPDEFRLPWLRYHAKWSNALSQIISYKDIPADAWTKTCLWFGCWMDCGQAIFQGLGAGVRSLNKVSDVFTDLVETHTKKCESCKPLCTKWEAYASSVVEKIGVFTETCMTPTPLARATK